jgi:small conductance mechanosensitive channel
MNWGQLSTSRLQEFLDMAIEQAVYIVPRLLLAFFILWLGFKLIKKLNLLIQKALIKLGVADTLRPFISSVINGALKIFLFMLIANIVGADITGLIAILAAAGFAVGMALQGSLGNFASGVLILSLRPYKTGDWVGVEDKFGKVEEIGIFNTHIVTPGRKLLIVPNSKITDTVVTNFSDKGVVRLEINVMIPYEESYPKAEALIKTTLKNSPLLLTTPEAEVGITNFDSHSVEIAVRPYVLPDDYWKAKYALYAAIKKAFHENDIKVAYAESMELGPIGE